jgi:hypothetical protein
MNIKQLIAAIAVLAISALAVLATTGPAFAVETAPRATQAQPVAVKIRAVIRAEAIPARTEGPLASVNVETTKPAAAVVKSRIALHTDARSLDTVHALRT